ncbi:MAG TPA: hypothetical protein VFV75_09360 [Candidatus Polarisedimenticolaceae bacterium]|nr:hypothetical protein [Candidatus Polarisedimenticolaceae bacterium]
MRSAAVLAIALASASPAAAQSDTTPPVVTSFGFTPASVDVTAASGTVQCTVHATDSPAGVYDANARFVSPSRTQVAYCYTALGAGTVFDGTWQGEATIPQHAEQGTWTAEIWQLHDNVGNFRAYSTGDLRQAGFATDLQVVSDLDTEAPIVTTFGFSPASVDVTEESKIVACTLHATDSLAGVEDANVRFVSPSGTQAAYCYTTLASGTIFDGTWQGQATIPLHAEDGTWKAEIWQLHDNVGNSRAYSTADLQQAGFSTDLAVTSEQDTDPPVVTSLDFSPKSIDVTVDAQTVACTLGAEDFPAGVADANVRFVSPSKTQSAYCYTTLVVGTALDGTWQGQGTVPRYAEEGIWTAEIWQLHDSLQNFTAYSTADLRQEGFPTDLHVGFVEGEPRAEIVSPRGGARIRGNAITVRARLSMGSPADVSPQLGVRFEFRPVAGGVFVPMPGASNLPNPDTTAPYLVHWDVTLVGNGDYELRAVAHALDGAPDPAPSTIVVTVRHGGPVEVEEGVQADGRQSSLTSVLRTASRAATSGDRTSTGAAAEVVVPAGALAATSDGLRIAYLDSSLEASRLDQPDQALDIFVKLSLQSGQSVFQDNLAGALDLAYSDANHDGLVDGTSIREQEIELLRYDLATQAYTPIPRAILTEHDLVHTMITGTGRFGLAGPQLPRLRFDDREKIAWDALGSAVAYAVYRGTLAALVDTDGDGLPDAGYGICVTQSDPDPADTMFMDPAIPGPGAAFTYLVTYRTGSGESSLGTTTAGLRRWVSVSCP